jgi:hypothetical protein
MVIIGVSSSRLRDPTNGKKEMYLEWPFIDITIIDSLSYVSPLNAGQVDLLKLASTWWIAWPDNYYLLFLNRTGNGRRDHTVLISVIFAS